MAAPLSHDLERRAYELFLAVFDRPVEERVSLLAGACGDNEALRREVSSLLDHHDAIRASEPQGLPGQAGDGVSDRFATGTVLADRYRIVSLLGRGGMGEVYRADDLKLGVPVALKFLPAGMEARGPLLEKLLHEVRIARRITHPSVCRVYDAGEVDGRHFLSMELIDGEDLASLVRRIGRLPPAKAVEAARQVAEGLAAAHAQGILHRDLKPANVMLDAAGRARITDFGLAAMPEEVRGAEVRSGTPAYMAPEQHAGQEVSVRSDLYALGLVLYELVTGEPAFEAESRAELLRLHREAAPVPPSRRVDGVPPALEQVILQCLDKEPRNRPASAAAVAAALADPIAATGPGSRPPGRILAAMATVGVLALALAAFLLSRDSGPGAGPANEVAARAYQRGRFLARAPATPERMRQALEELHTAIEADPGFAGAHAEVALLYVALSQEGLIPVAEAREMAEAACRRALALDPGLGRAHGVLGIVLFALAWDFEEAGRELRRALELDPGDPLVRNWYVRYLLSRGRIDEALAEHRRLADADPAVLRFDYESYLLNAAGRHRLALARILEQQEVSPDSIDLQLQLAGTYLWLGREEDSVRAYRRYVELTGAGEARLADVDAAIDQAGVNGVLRYHLAELELLPRTFELQAEVLALLGETDLALDRLQKAVEGREQAVLYVVSEPAFQAIRDHPRFGEVIRRIGLR